MNHKWLILILIIFIYLPVSIDATVLHVAVPTLSLELGSTTNELLWIIDIYSLMMAGLLLPMGALGDKIGYKKLAIIGLIIFGIASLGAALAPNSIMLIIFRAVLAIGAAMILPATLAGIRKTFLDESERSSALGVWATVGVCGAAIGPLVGGYLLQHFYWGAVFLINIPIIFIALIATLWVVPKQPQNTQQQWQISKALVLITALLMLIYAIKSGFRADNSILVTFLIGGVGAVILYIFVKQELSAKAPMIDFGLLKIRVLTMGIIMAMTAMISIVGFELLMAQELQLVHGLTPLKAGIFMLPLMLASGFGGPLAGWLVPRLGLRIVATTGIGLSALSFFGLAVCDFMVHPYLAWSMMVLLGLSIGIALLASTTAIMSSAPAEKSASAGAIEGMAYELGAGFGVVIFGMMLSIIFSQNIMIPDAIPTQLAVQATHSINEAFLAANTLDDQILSSHLILAAKNAFIHSHVFVLLTAGVLFSILTVFIWKFLPDRN
ncbi:MFS transporter [Neisseria sp. Ec49-e6-T10]|uniref:MFS transporter n=1 Tax=Neisseria sp. Ec49-e6-T10 TaxID=3140744 RepID=UPI003EB8F9DC